MDAETASDDTPIDNDAPLPGARLREAREKQGLTVETVAEDLRLMTSQIRALESDDFEQFPAPIYVIGYVRKYAERLDLDAAPLVAALEHSALKTPPIRSELTARHIPMPHRRGLPPSLWMAVAVAAVIVLLAALWWLTRPGPLVTDNLPDEPAPVTERMDEVLPAPVAPAAPVEPVAPAVPAEPESPVAVEPPAAVETPAPAGPGDELVLIFSGSSWIEVVDVTGRRLAYRMGNDGDVLTLQGLAPFDILLGNAPNVAVEYNGEPYRDIPVSRHNVASFTLGHPADEQ